MEKKYDVIIVGGGLPYLLYQIGFITHPLWLPICAVVLYVFTPGRYRNYMLFVINAVYYLLVGWRAAAITAAAAVFDYGIALFIDTSRGKRRISVLRTPAVALAVTKNVAGAVFLKVVAEFDSSLAVSGFVVYALTATGYLLDVFRGDEKAERDPVRFILFSTLFCKMFAGPLVRYGELREQLAGEEGRRRLHLEGVGEGLVLFLYGAAKKVLLADRLTEFGASLAEVNALTPSLLGSWLRVIVFALRIFFELSGFSDMARGLGLVFGLRLPSNFYYPYQSVSISDFLYRFNTTVTKFFRHYVYDLIVPKDEDREDKKAVGVVLEVLGTLLVCLLFGMWFGVKLNYIIWGAYLAFFILMERFFLGRLLDAIPRLFRRVYSFVIVMFSFVAFSAPDASGTLTALKELFGFSRRSVPAELTWLLSGNWLQLAVSLLFSTSLFSMIGRMISKKAKPVTQIVSAVLSVALLALIVIFSL